MLKKVDDFKYVFNKLHLPNNIIMYYHIYKEVSMNL